MNNNFKIPVDEALLFAEALEDKAARTVSDEWVKRELIAYADHIRRLIETFRPKDQA